MTTSRSTWTVPVTRHEYISPLDFDVVLANIHSGLGHPDFPALLERLNHAADWSSFTTVVDDNAGPSGLMVFLELDLGSVLALDPSAIGYKAVRIIAGNPVTMAAMTRSTPAAGAFAPITILIFDADDGVHCRYDSIVSATGAELTAEATGTAQRLDTAVLELLAAATS